MKRLPDEDLKLTVHARPGSKHVGVVRNEDGSFTVRVREKALEGRANDAVVRAIAAEFKVAPSRVSLIRGARSRIKVLLVRGKAD